MRQDVVPSAHTPSTSRSVRKTNRRLGCLLVLFCLAPFTSCSGNPVPLDKSAYVGDWRGPGLSLTITSDGGVIYNSVTSTGNRKFKASITAFQGDDFVVGALGLTAVVEVSRPPFREDATWKMVADGVELTRVPPRR